METLTASVNQSNNLKWLNPAEIISLDKVNPLEIDWLWPNHIPLGMLSLIAGDPGIGKSFLTLYMAATVSTGGPWPDSNSCRRLPAHEDTVCENRESSIEHQESSIENRESSIDNQESSIEDRESCGSAIILNNEDSPARVIRPRLSALNANLSKIKVIPFVWHKDKNGNEFTDCFNITTDLRALDMTLSEIYDAKLIIIDPISAFFGRHDTYKDSYVRAVLNPLNDLARKYNVAIVGVMHLNKGISTKAVYRTMGSMAFPAAARTVWLVSSVPGSTNNPRCLFIPVKHNVLEKPATLAFEIKNNRVVFEKEHINISAEVLLSPKSNIESPELNRAIDWLTNLLADGNPKPSKEIFKLAELQCFKEITLQRARKELGIKCFPDTDKQGYKFWCWKLPKVTDEEPKMLSLAELNKKLHEKIKKSFQRGIIIDEDDDD